MSPDSPQGRQEDSAPQIQHSTPHSPAEDSSLSGHQHNEEDHTSHLAENQSPATAEHGIEEASLGFEPSTQADTIPLLNFNSMHQNQNHNSSLVEPQDSLSHQEPQHQSNRGEEDTDHHGSDHSSASSKAQASAQHSRHEHPASASEQPHSPNASTTDAQPHNLQSSTSTQPKDPSPQLLDPTAQFHQHHQNLSSMNSSLSVGAAPITSVPNSYLIPEDDQVMYLSKISTKIQKIYRRDASAASRADKNKELELDELLEELQTHVVSMRDALNEKNYSLREELDRMRQLHEQKINEWSARYEKVQNRWQNLMKEMRLLQHQKEEIRQERDLLLCEHKQNFRKKALLRGEPTTDEKKAVKEFFIQSAHEILQAVRTALGAERASIFVYDHPSNRLVSLALVPQMSSPDGRDVQIVVPSNAGIVGDVFTKGRALNILNAYKDNRFYKGIDEKTGYVTRVVLAYPIISKTTGTSIGCIQLINKESGVFTIEDEARMSQFIYIISRLFDCVETFYDFGSGGGSVGFGGDESMTDSQSSSLINVKRIGEKDSSTPNDIGFLQKHGALIPKYIEDFIHKLHKCWRIAVDESGKYQNKIAKLKQDKHDQENVIRDMRRELEKKRILIESLNKTIVAFSRESLINQAMSLSSVNGGGSSPSASGGGSSEMQFQLGRMKQMHKRLQNLDETLIENGMTPISEASNFNASHTAASPGGVSPAKKKRIESFSSNHVSLPVIHERAGANSSSTGGPGAMSSVHRDNSSNSGASGHYLRNNNTKGRMDFAINYHHRSKGPQYLPEGMLYTAVFEGSPLPMLLLSTSYHICACNKQFCRQLNYRPRDLIGMMFQNILFKIDVDMLPRLLQFEFVESISVKRRHKKEQVHSTSKLMSSCLKMDIHIGQIGQQGTQFKLPKPSRVVNAPLYVLTFSKSENQRENML